MGAYVNSHSINHFSYVKKIDEDFENQKSTVYLNNIPNAFAKVEESLSKIKDPHKKWKTTNGIRTIEAFNCSLKNIDIISNFFRLIELNISSNPELTSLKGI